MKFKILLLSFLALNYFLIEPSTKKSFNNFNAKLEKFKNKYPNLNLIGLDVNNSLFHEVSGFKVREENNFFVNQTNLWVNLNEHFFLIAGANFCPGTNNLDQRIFTPSIQASLFLKNFAFRLGTYPWIGLDLILPFRENITWVSSLEFPIINLKNRLYFNKNLYLSFDAGVGIFSHFFGVGFGYNFGSTYIR